MYTDALPLAPHSAALFDKLGGAHAASHAFRAAAAEYSKAVRLAPADVKLRLRKVDMLLRLRDVEHAAAELDECDAVAEVWPVTTQRPCVSLCPRVCTASELFNTLRAACDMNQAQHGHASSKARI